MLKHFILLVLIAVIIVGGIAVFFFSRGPQTKYDNITVEQAEKLIAAGEVMVIDVREPYEYQSGHIPKAKLIPLGTLPGGLAGLDTEKPYLLVCRSGNRSAQAASIMVKAGFKNVSNMSGGMLAWKGKIEN